MGNALCIAGLAGIGGFIGYMCAGLFVVSAPLAVAAGAITFIGMGACAAEDSED